MADPSSSSTTLTMPAADVEVTATYKEKPEEKYNLTVINGAGSGTYQAGRVVSIAADAAPENREFDLWTGDTSHVSDINSPNTSVTMPDKDITLTATYKDKPETTYRLSVINSTGGGDYQENVVTGIAADIAAEGKVFSA